VQAPRVSFVVASRNDDHGGSPKRRTELFVHGLAALCSRFAVSAELILVEWNPPADRPALAESLEWPADPGPLEIRILTVPEALHRRVKNSERIPFYQMIAKNAGIRRARGEFVVATNIDLLLSEALVWFLGHGPLRADAVYRVERLDLRLRDLPHGLDIDEQLALCSLNVARSNNLRETVELPALASRRLFGHTAERWPGFAPGELERLLAEAEWPWAFYNACGDFTMLARSQWMELTGHPELPLYSLHIDSLMLRLAMSYGLTQIVLPDPMRTYHIEHGMGWNVEQDRDRITADRPVLQYEQLLSLISSIESIGPHVMANRADWGFRDDALPEWRYAPLDGARAA
jgi:hypothetical protein